jgi:hypothetical protein
VLVIMATSSVVQFADDTAIGAQTTRIAMRNERIFSNMLGHLNAGSLCCLAMQLNNPWKF